MPSKIAVSPSGLSDWASADVMISWRTQSLGQIAGGFAILGGGGAFDLGIESSGRFRVTAGLKIEAPRGLRCSQICTPVTAVSTRQRHTALTRGVAGFVRLASNRRPLWAW